MLRKNTQMLLYILLPSEKQPPQGYPFYGAPSSSWRSLQIVNKKNDSADVLYISFVVCHITTLWSNTNISLLMWKIWRSAEPQLNHLELFTEGDQRQASLSRQTTAQAKPRVIWILVLLNTQHGVVNGNSF